VFDSAIFRTGQIIILELHDHGNVEENV